MGTLLVAALPPDAACQVPQRADSVQSSAAVPALVRRPQLRVGREIALIGTGAGLFVAEALVSPTLRVVPPQGLDPLEIAWSLDRDVLGNRSVHAARASDRTLVAAVALPIVLAAVTSGFPPGWVELGSSALVYAETFLVSQGITRLAKAGLGRARPYAYLPASARPEEGKYDVTKERTFRSMPSGHSSSAWTGAAIALTEHLLRRPEAGFVERAGAGFVAGAFAGATSALRVDAGQHFPSDVAVGAGIGLITGVTVPLLHRGTRSLPTTTVLLQSVGGLVVGTVAGVTLGARY